MIYKQRMYHLVAYQLSGIQKGIQALHSAIEYARLRGHTDEFAQWADHDKTTIILNGGTTNSDAGNRGTIQLHTDKLIEFKIPYVVFREPDLNDTVTAVAFLADERVWDFVKFPETGFKLTTGWDSYDDLMHIEYLKDRYHMTEGQAKLREYLKTLHLAQN